MKPPEIITFGLGLYATERLNNILVIHKPDTRGVPGEYLNEEDVKGCKPYVCMSFTTPESVSNLIDELVAIRDFLE